MPRRVHRPQAFRARRHRRRPGMFHWEPSTWACPPDRVRERFSPVRASRSHMERRRAVRFCRVRRDRTPRCRSVPASHHSSRVAKARRRAVILCARPWQASRPCGRWCRRVPIWSRVFPSSKPSLLRASPPLPGRACPRLDDRFTRGRALASRPVRVPVDRATRWVPAVRRCVAGGRTPPRRCWNRHLRRVLMPAAAMPRRSEPSSTTSANGTAKAESELSARANRNPLLCP